MRAIPFSGRARVLRRCHSMLHPSTTLRSISPACLNSRFLQLGASQFSAGILHRARLSPLRQHHPNAELSAGYPTNRQIPRIAVLLTVLTTRIRTKPITTKPSNRFFRLISRSTPLTRLRSRASILQGCTATECLQSLTPQLSLLCSLRPGADNLSLLTVAVFPWSTPVLSLSGDKYCRTIQFAGSHDTLDEVLRVISLSAPSRRVIFLPHSHQGP